MTGRSMRYAAGFRFALMVVMALTAGCGRERRSGVPTVAEPAGGSRSVAVTATEHPPHRLTTSDSANTTLPGGEATASELAATNALDPNALDPNALDPNALATAPPIPNSDDEPDSRSPLARKQFDGWSTPSVVLLVTGQQHGYIEPCGCTTLANQKGGLARRHTLVKKMTARGWPIIGLDAGNQVRRFGRQAEIKFHMTLEGLKTIGYQAIVLGADDLRLSVDELVAATVPLAGEATPFLCANAAVLDWSLMPDHKLIEQGGKKIGVTAIVGERWQEDVSRDDVLFKDPAEGLRSVMPKLQAANCDMLVLLAHTSVAESKKLAREFPQFHVVVSAGAPGDSTDPLYQPEVIDGTKAMFVQSGTKGMFAGVIGVFDEEETPLRYQRVPLDDTFKDSPEMLKLLKSYQNQLETVGLSGLGLRSVPHPSGNKFTGSEKCGECHTEAFASWEQTPHASATDSLANPVERAEIQRHFDPECLSCHVTGWNPKRFFPYTSGYLDLEKSIELHGNGCENCHGPGSAHVDAEEGTTAVDESTLEALRKSMRLPIDAAEKKCVECHDIDNSPDFFEKDAFQRYWKDVEHKGLD